ncbi:BTAD domain-containing putative transcriptional regulator [Actinoplanes sp. GCM10030250]|uniref:AfsR/SARP family transcriptional regulator n=1 Tax=Actinoplanes sp. GCM10030250 TaxID=3273376 RepID=UPI0036182C7B
MQVRVLGPLEVLIDGRRLDLGGQRQQIVLAVLALETGQVVPVGRLAEALYGDDPPSTARSQVQICVSALRRLLPDAIVTRAQGYQLRLPAGSLDLAAFTDLAARARTDPSLHRAALGLWRGPALDGLDSRVLRAAAGRLEERRISLHEDCAEWELELGHHRDLVPELIELVARHPLRERLRGQLMLALYRSGRQAEALEVYRQARRALIEELGLEPGPGLRQLEQSILTSAADLDAPAAPGNVPCLLPTDIADFTGRAEQAAAIGGRLAAAGPAVPVVVVAGPPGIGKTTLAVHVAHRAAARFPDGQLFADLHGWGPRRADPAQVLERFLRTLGVSGTAMPETLEERAETYRSLLSGRRMLIVLDNAAQESQVLPLLPGTPSSAVLVTSRVRLAGLPGATHLDVGVLDPAHSRELLARIAGPDRVEREPEAVDRLAHLCGYLPLALRIAGARLSARRHWTVAHLVGRLEDEARRLDELSHSGMAIRGGMSLTYDSLRPPARQLFRRLAILEVPSFSGWVSAALLDRPVTDAQDILDDLVEARLIEVTGGPRYRFHDLIRVFARERLAAEEPAAEQRAALRRFLESLLFLAEAARRGVYGGGHMLISSDAELRPLPGLPPDPTLSWLEREDQTLVAGIAQAAAAGLSDLCWSLAVTGVTLFELRFRLDDWRESNRTATAAVQRAGNLRGQAAMHYSTGSLFIVEQRLDEARRHLEAAERMFGEIGDEKGQALAIRNIALTERIRGDLPSATARYERALGIFRRGGHLGEAAYTLHNLARARMEEGDPAEALRILPEALAMSRDTGSRRVEAQVLHRIGEAHLHLADPRAAAGAFSEALAVARDIRDRVGEAYTLHGLGVAHLRAGDPAAAGPVLRAALSLARGADERLIEALVSLSLGELALTTAEPAGAHLRRALELFRGIGVPKYEEQALSLLDSAAKVRR